MEQTNIYSTIYQLYLNNLNFLEKNYPSVFQKVAVLTQSIENKEYSEKYALEYEEQKGCFNILDIETNKMVYENNSYESSDKIAKDATYDKNDALNLLSIDFDTNKLLLGTFVKDLDPIKKTINNDIDFKEYEYLKIYKYIFMGTGLGIHIKGIVDKFNPNAIFIVEPNIEIFHLSLFITDYTELFNKTKIFFSVAQGRNERLVAAQHFYKYQPYLNYVVKFHLFDAKYKNVLDDIYKKFTQEHSESFSYTPQLIGIRRTIDRVKEKVKFLDLKGIREKDIFVKKPSLIIGAGPSTRKNIEWIKANQDKFYIVGVSTITPLLIEYDIKPDMICVIDYNDVIEKFFVDENLKEFAKDTVILLPTQVSPKVIEKFDAQNIRYLQTYNVYDDLAPSYISSNVGAYALNTMGILKSKEIYSIGIDCAYDQEDGSMHSSNNVISRSFDVDKQEGRIKAKGNLREFVFTTDELLSYKNSFELVAYMFREDKEYQFYNLSDGAFIEGIEPKEIALLEIDSFPTLDKKSINKTILETYNIAKDIHFKEDMEYLSAIEKLFKKNLKANFKTRDSLIGTQIELLSNVFDIMTKTSRPIFAYLLMELIEVSGIYVYFYLNVRGNHLSNPQKLNNINIKWINLAIKVLQDIQDCFNCVD